MKLLPPSNATPALSQGQAAARAECAPTLGEPARLSCLQPPGPAAWAPSTKRALLQPAPEQVGELILCPTPPTSPVLRQPEGLKGLRLSPDRGNPEYGGQARRRPLEGPRSGGGVPQQGGEPGAPQALLYQRLPGSSCPWTPGFRRAHTSSHLSPKSRENVSNCMTHGPTLCWLTGRGSPGHWWGDRGRGSTGFRQPEAESLALAASHTPSSASFMPGRPDQA